ncbi:MAG: hypothetical protein WC011_02705 [Candidatus Paceibacterota bacterium]
MGLKGLNINLSAGLPGIDYFVKIFNEEYPQTKNFDKIVNAIWSKFSPFSVFRDKYPRVSTLSCAISTEKARLSKLKKEEERKKLVKTVKNKKSCEVVQLSLKF